MQQLSLETIPSQKEEKKKQRLRALIQRKQALLENLVIKTEMLRVNLEIAKQEYMVKVGSLFLKDNQLDLEIIRLKNILQLMEKGFTYDNAVSHIAKTYYAEQIELEREQERMQQEEEIFKKREANDTHPNGNSKKLWKKLIAKFHPDLVQDPKEKQKREAIMKQVNRAYQEGDFEKLLRIDQDNLSEHEQTVDTLEDILLRIIKNIMRQNTFYKSLKTSEWYDWMIKIERAKRKQSNIFAETERQLLNDIVAKLELIKDLKKQIETKGSLFSLS